LPIIVVCDRERKDLEDSMRLDSRLGAPPPEARTAGWEVPHLRAAEAIEWVDCRDLPSHFGPARGILNAVAIGAGAWMLILAAVALTRAILFG
jgi:hypothetical protein